MTALHGGRIDKLEIYPNLWAGVGLVRGGAGTALVGSHEEVANLIYEYHSVGFDEFILSGYPHLEEAYWFAEGVLPLLRSRKASPDSTSGPPTRQQTQKHPDNGMILRLLAPMTGQAEV